MQRDDARTGTDHSRLRALGLINVAAGFWIIVLPFAFHLPRRYPHQLTFWATLTTGVLVLTLAALHVPGWSSFRRASRANVVLGLWLAASPAFIGYTKFLPNGGDVALASVFTGLAVVAGAALSLAGSDDAGPDDAPTPESSPPAYPVLWPEPAPGQPPRPYTSLAGEPDQGKSS